MKTLYLFPNKLKIPSFVLFVLSTIFFIPSFEDNLFNISGTVFSIASQYPFGKTSYFTFLSDELSSEIVTGLFVISGIILAFSKEKIEDEFIQSIRFRSLVNATFFTYSMTLLCIFFIYGLSFLSIVTSLIFIHLIILNIFYYTKLFIYKKRFSHENEN